MPRTAALLTVVGYSVILFSGALHPLPAGVMQPMALCSANQMLPSAPSAMPKGWLSAVGMGNSSILPVVISTRPMLLSPGSVNHMVLVPDGPAAIIEGMLCALGMA